MEQASKDEERRKVEKPQATPEEVIKIALEHFGKTADPVSVKELNSYDDRNFYFRSTEGEEYTLKIHNGVESLDEGVIHLQNAVMAHLQKDGIECPQPLPSVDGRLVAFHSLKLADGTDRSHAVRLLTWIPGRIMEDVEQGPEVLRAVGAFVGRMDRSLQGLAAEGHPALDRAHLWDLRHSLGLRTFLPHVPHAGRRALAAAVLDRFEADVLAAAPALRLQPVHNDANDQNILFAPRAAAAPALVPTAVIDFGDVLRTWVVNEVAISMAYMMLGKADPLGAGAAVLAGYLAEFALTEPELRALPTLVQARLVCSVVMGCYGASLDPANEYLLLTQEPGWKVLEVLCANDAAHNLKLLLQNNA